MLSSVDFRENVAPNVWEPRLLSITVYSRVCGDTIEEALSNLKDAVELYFRNEPKKKLSAALEIS